MAKKGKKGKKCVTWRGFLKEGMPIAHTKHRTHGAAIREVARDWKQYKKSAVYRHKCG